MTKELICVGLIAFNLALAIYFPSSFVILNAFAVLFLSLLFCWRHTIGIKSFDAPKRRGL